MTIEYRDMTAGDFDRCLEIRGKTRENAIPLEVLRKVGVTAQAWLPQIRAGIIAGVVVEADGVVVGFCSGDTATGEVLVLALLPDYEGRGLGRTMLTLVMDKLWATGKNRLWLATGPDPHTRAHGFYRHLGWVSTGTFDQHGDEVLEYPGT